VNNELEKRWKWSWPNLKDYPRICLETLKKFTKNELEQSVLYHIFEPGISEYK